MRYEIVDKAQTFKDYIDLKIKNEDIEVVNFEFGEVWGMAELVAGDILNNKIIFIRKIYD